jgi:hypothetical protein
VWYNPHTMENTTSTAPVKNKSPKFVRWAVMLGIVIALNIFFLVANSLVFPQPKYEDYCPLANRPAPQTEKSCADVGGEWYPGTGDVTAGPQTTPKAPLGYCDMTSKCQKPFETAMQDHQMKTFVLMVGFGVLSIIVGVLPIGSSIVSTGLSYGGVLALVIGAAQYWSEAGDWLRLAIAALALAALIYIGIRRFRD